MVSFSQLPAVKKDTVFGAARKFFGPSYFVTALLNDLQLAKLLTKVDTIVLFVSVSLVRENQRE